MLNNVLSLGMFTVIFTKKFSMEKYTHVPGPPYSIALYKLAPPNRILHRT